MELFNEIILVCIGFVALVSLVVEMEDRRDFKHELLLKIGFGSLTVGAFSAAFYETLLGYTAMNMCFLSVLVIRLMSCKKV